MFRLNSGEIADEIGKIDMLCGETFGVSRVDETFDVFVITAASGSKSGQ